MRRSPERGRWRRCRRHRQGQAAKDDGRGGGGRPGLAIQVVQDVVRGLVPHDEGDFVGFWVCAISDRVKPTTGRPLRSTVWNAFGSSPGRSSTTNRKSQLIGAVRRFRQSWRRRAPSGASPGQSCARRRPALPRAGPTGPAGPGPAGRRGHGGGAGCVRRRTARDGHCRDQPCQPAARHHLSHRPCPVAPPRRRRDPVGAEYHPARPA